MAIKLVRANSDTPNIQNSDDSRLFRYACGGYDGVVKNYGNELNYEITGSNFKVKSGEFVIDGWQGDVDGNGVTIQVDNLGGIQYYVVYAEIDLSVSANQKAEIKAIYNTAYYPTISRGDDLTTTPSGVARLELYRFEASSGVINNVTQVFNVIEYGWCKNAENATNADLATNATNSIYNTENGTYSQFKQTNGILRVGDDNSKNIVEKKTLLWSGSKIFYNTASVGSEVTLSENVVEGDVLEIHYDCSVSSTPKYKVVRCIVGKVSTNNIGFKLSSLYGGQTTGSGFSLTQDNFKINANKLIYDGGYYLLNLANNGGTLLSNNMIELRKVYKIIS